MGDQDDDDFAELLGEEEAGDDEEAGVEDGDEDDGPGNVADTVDELLAEDDGGYDEAGDEEEGEEEGGQGDEQTDGAHQGSGNGTTTAGDNTGRTTVHGQEDRAAAAQNEAAGGAGPSKRPPPDAYFMDPSAMGRTEDGGNGARWHMGRDRSPGQQRGPDRRGGRGGGGRWGPGLGPGAAGPGGPGRPWGAHGGPQGMAPHMNPVPGGPMGMHGGSRPGMPGMPFPPHGHMGPMMPPGAGFEMQGMGMGMPQGGPMGPGGPVPIRPGVPPPRPPSGPPPPRPPGGWNPAQPPPPHPPLSQQQHQQAQPQQAIDVNMPSILRAPGEGAPVPPGAQQPRPPPNGPPRPPSAPMSTTPPPGAMRMPPGGLPSPSALGGQGPGNWGWGGPSPQPGMMAGGPNADMAAGLGWPQMGPMGMALPDAMLSEMGGGMPSWHVGGLPMPVGAWMAGAQPAAGPVTVGGTGPGGLRSNKWIRPGAQPAANDTTQGRPTGADGPGAPMTRQGSDSGVAVTDAAGQQPAAEPSATPAVALAVQAEQGERRKAVPGSSNQAGTAARTGPSPAAAAVALKGRPPAASPSGAAGVSMESLLKAQEEQIANLKRMIELKQLAKKSQQGNGGMAKPSSSAQPTPLQGSGVPGQTAKRPANGSGAEVSDLPEGLAKRLKRAPPLVQAGRAAASDESVADQANQFCEEAGG